MKRTVAGWAVAAAAWAAVAGATEVRTASLGGVEWAVSDAAGALNLFTTGNAAGLGLLPRANRLDEALDISNATDVTDSGALKTTRASRVTSLESPGGRYEGLTWWITDADVVRAAIGHTGARSTVSSVPALPQGDQVTSAADTRFLVQYTRKLTDQLVLGALIRPLVGSVTSPKTTGIKSDTSTYTLFDYNVGAGFRLPVEGGQVDLGANLQPYNDAPNPLDVLVPGAPSAGSGSFGGLKFERKIETDAGLKQTIDLTPKGSVLGVQAVLNRGENLEARFALDFTRAETEEKQVTDASVVPGGGTKTDVAKVTAYGRTRYDLSGRYRIPVAGDAFIRLAAALRGAPDSLDALNFPTDTSVRSTTTTTPTTFALGAAYQAAGGFVAGLGFDVTRDTQTVVDKLGGSPDQVTKVASSDVRLGAEYWPTAGLATRIGLVLNSQASDSNDPSQPPSGSDPANPKYKDTIFALGIGYKGESLAVDGGIFIHGLSQEPKPAPPVTIDRKRSSLRLALTWLI